MSSNNNITISYKDLQGRIDDGSLAAAFQEPVQGENNQMAAYVKFDCPQRFVLADPNEFPSAPFGKPTPYDPNRAKKGASAPAAAAVASVSDQDKTRLNFNLSLEFPAHETAMRNLQDWALDFVCANAEKFWPTQPGKKPLSRDVIESRGQSCIKESKDPKYKPTLQTKMDMGSDPKKAVTIYVMKDGVRVNGTTNDIVAHCRNIPVIVINKIWASPTQWGLQMSTVEDVVIPPVNAGNVRGDFGALNSLFESSDANAAPASPAAAVVPPPAASFVAAPLPDAEDEEQDQVAVESDAESVSSQKRKEIVVQYVNGEEEEEVAVQAPAGPKASSGKSKKIKTQA